METYEELLDKAYEKVKVVHANTERFEVPKVTGQIEGKNTIISNIPQIASYVRRPVEQLAKFIQKELAVPGRMENDRLILIGKINSSKVNDKVQQYLKEFVICNECGKPDTEILADKGIKYKNCLACGAKSPIRKVY